MLAEGKPQNEPRLSRRNVLESVARPLIRYSVGPPAVLGGNDVEQAVGTSYNPTQIQRSVVVKIEIRFERIVDPVRLLAGLFSRVR
jgi:hypothetical protein